MYVYKSHCTINVNISPLCILWSFSISDCVRRLSSKGQVWARRSVSFGFWMWRHRHLFLFYYWFYLWSPAFPLKCKRSHTQPVWALFAYALNLLTLILPYVSTDQPWIKKKKQYTLLFLVLLLLLLFLLFSHLFSSYQHCCPHLVSSKGWAELLIVFLRDGFWRWKVHIKWNPKQPQTGNNWLHRLHTNIRTALPAGSWSSETDQGPRYNRSLLKRYTGTSVRGDLLTSVCMN